MLLERCRNPDHRISEAARDYRYLLDRGYSRKPSLDLVVSRYVLNKSERSLLLRCVHDSKYLSKISKIVVTNGEIAGSPLIIDLLNVCTTVIAFLEGECLYLCDDGFVRDLGGSRYWKGKKEKAIEALGLVAEHIAATSPEKVYLVIDRRAPMSLNILAHAEDLVGRVFPREVVGIAESKADRRIIDLQRSLADKGGVVSTSDAVILGEVSRAYDLAGKIVVESNKHMINRTLHDLLHP